MMKIGNFGFVVLALVLGGCGDVAYDAENHTIVTETVSCHGANNPTGITATFINKNLLELLRAKCAAQGGKGSFPAQIQIELDPNTPGDVEKVTKIIRTKMVTEVPSSSCSDNEPCGTQTVTTESQQKVSYSIVELCPTTYTYRLIVDGVDYGTHTLGGEACRQVRTLSTSH